MKDRSSNSALPAAAAISFFIIGSIAIAAIQNKDIKHPVKDVNQSAKAEECIMNPSNAICKDINYSTLDPDLSDRLRAAVLAHESTIANKKNNGITSKQLSARLVSTAQLFDACKKYISELMGREKSIMNSDYDQKAEGIVGISYIRSDDQTLFEYECRSDGNNIVWRGVNIFGPNDGPGRWRDEDIKPIADYM